jgi:plasmid stabilization system protein ParE
MSFDVRFSASAEDDLMRLCEFLLDRAANLEDLELAQAAIESRRSASVHQLASTPHSFRKSGKSSTRRELIISFGATGYVARIEIASASTVLALAVRHQREGTTTDTKRPAATRFGSILGRLKAGCTQPIQWTSTGGGLPKRDARDQRVPSIESISTWCGLQLRCNRSADFTSIFQTCSVQGSTAAL